MRWVLASALAAACYGPDPGVGAPCNTALECPAPLTCDRGLCVREPAPDASADAPGWLPSNGVDIAPALALSRAITIDGIATFDGETGAIGGAVSRPMGSGVRADIGYEQRTYLGAPLAVFSFASLELGAGSAIRFAPGERSIVFVVARGVQIDGSIDVGAGCAHGDCPGPGGGGGTTLASAGGGCGGGGPGISDETNGGDAGGGGGGGGGDGGRGGNDNRGGVQVDGGSAGLACIAARIEPLRGGSGGGGGGDGAATPTSGGGGGGALQITAYGSISIAGTIEAGGAGGEAGPADLVTTNAGAGGGGGAGGAILLEAPSIAIAPSGIVAANGGGGGGGAEISTPGVPGSRGAANATPAPGGVPPGNGGIGGNGGAGTTPAQQGADRVQANAGGGGGGVGRILLRAGSPSVQGVVSPPPGMEPL